MVLLVRDLNQNGLIDGGQELFGDATMLNDGRTAADGFEALASLDQDGDGWITASDAGFGQLSVWRDANQDGVTNDGELSSLDSLGISRLQVSAEGANLLSEGNRIGLTATFERVDGSSSTVADVWLRFIEADSPDERAVAMGDALSGYQTSGPETTLVGTQGSSRRSAEASLEQTSPAVMPPDARWAALLGDALSSYQDQLPRGLEKLSGDASDLEVGKKRDEVLRRNLLASPQGWGGSSGAQ